ncbi:MerR family transcriptional regulator [Thermomonospora umbrina]|uniref:DNA-binding transcriptional MerR regulator n=1 Tax=Thermomonospora umbrina TaxID=111806 RepID=A0A3D9SPM2_9ACTN|nr:MerR family transcriptional regulator [Thermomonospora umbrina]REE97916.1 DNA-binding transcriptional MerR regulator [Thermomonospora umbrina]
MRIGELARLTGVNQRLLRYYEEQDLLHPLRRASGYRDYDDADVERVRRIRTLLAAGLNTTTIADVLPCTIDTDDGLAGACPALLGDLRREHARISASITELHTARTMLAAIIDATPHEAPENDSGRPSDEGERPSESNR